MLFVKTMKSYGYETAALLEFVAVVLRDRFLEISSNVVLTLFKKVSFIINPLLIVF